jgi:hypothetical protein
MDFKLIETGNGGDFVLLGNDIQMISGIQNMPYLGMFGGNTEASTNGPKIADEQAFDWWGNNLLSPNNSVVQMNSILEKTLNETPISTSGRATIKNAALRDLSFMTNFSTIGVEVILTGIDRIRIEVKIQEPANKQSTQLTYIWDATNQELSIEQSNNVI